MLDLALNQRQWGALLQHLLLAIHSFKMQ